MGIKLKRAETAVARAKEGRTTGVGRGPDREQLAEAAKAVSEDGKRRVREATHEGKQEVQQRTQEARERYGRLIEQEREEANQEVANGSSGSPLT